MLERFELDPTKKARTYSKGNRQKVALVAALASDAELLLLDEPTSGLDPLMEAAFTESIREVKAAGRSVLLSSHIFSEVEKLADRVTIIRDGVTVESGTIAELRHLTRTQVSTVLDGGADGLATLPGVHDLAVVDGRRDVRGRRRRAADRARRGRGPAPAFARGQPAVARGPVPAPLRRRAGGAGQRERSDDRHRPGARGRARRTPSDAAATLAGAGPMVRFVVRRNRVRLAVWFVVLVGMFAYVASYYKELFPTQQSLDDFAALSDTPGIKALTGLSAAADTLGGAVWTKSWMTIALEPGDRGRVPRHAGTAGPTRRSGRTELLRSRMLGVHAYSAASWLVIGLLCVAVGLGIALVSAANGLDPDGTGDRRVVRHRRLRDRRRPVRARRRRGRRPGGVDLTRRQRAGVRGDHRLLRRCGWSATSATVR